MADLTPAEAAMIKAYWGSVDPVDVGPLIDATASTAKTTKMRIYGPIASIGAPYAVSAKEFAAALDDVDADTIELHIHSPGGSAFDGVAIMNQLQQHPAKVNVVVDGLAASAASLIAMAGDSITVAPSAQIMIHDPSALVIGQPDDLRQAADMLDKTGDSYADAYAAKAGGTRAQWREAMQPETWYTAAEAVKAGLADRVLPKSKPASEPKTAFDLTIFAHAGREHAPEPFIPAPRAVCACGPDGAPAVEGAQHRDECAHKPPAEAPEKPQPKGAVEMTDEQRKALCASLGLQDDADDAAIQAKAEELAKRPETAEVTEDAALAALAKTAGVEPDKVKAAVDAAKAGKVTVSQAYLDTIEGDAKAGREARTKQLADERDATIKAAQNGGKLARDDETFARWVTAWDADPVGTRADLDKLGVRFPVGEAKGYAGHDGTAGDGVAMTDTEADALAQLAGVSKEALLHG